MKISVKCKYCKKDFEANRKDNVYCSSACKRIASYYKNHERNKEVKRYRYYNGDKEKQRDYVVNNKDKVKVWKITYAKKRHDKGYQVYYSMRERCNNIKCHCYHRYGGRGIKCLITRDEFIQVFYRTNNCEMCGKILQDENRKLHNGRNIDRKNNDGDYSIDNIQIICSTCNSRKDNWLSKLVKEMKNK